MADKSMTAEQASARLAELLGNGRPGSGDQNFIKKYMAGGAAERKVVAELHETVAGVHIPAPVLPPAERAREMQRVLERDPEFVTAYLNGDVKARHDMAMLIGVMAGDEGATAKFTASLAEAEKGS